MIIARDQLERFFSDTRELYRTGKAKFNIDDVCQWSYFFVDPRRDAFVGLAAHLETSGYRNVGLLNPDALQDSSEVIYFLRADRVERITVDDLLSRNKELTDLARRFGVKDYDGMDVGQIDGI